MKKILLKDTESIIKIEDAKGKDITKKEIEKIKSGRHYLMAISEDYWQAVSDMKERMNDSEASLNSLRNRKSVSKISRNAPLPSCDL